MLYRDRGLVEPVGGMTSSMVHRVTTQRGLIGSRRGTRFVASSLLLALPVLVATACGDDESLSASGGAVDEWINRSGAEDPSRSPISEFLGLTSKGGISAEMREETKRQQREVAECMREQGFDYIEYDPIGASESDLTDPFGGLTRSEFTKKWGFAISTVVSADGGASGAPSPALAGSSSVRTCGPNWPSRWRAASVADVVLVLSGWGASVCRPLPPRSAAQPCWRFTGIPVDLPGRGDGGGFRLQRPTARMRLARLCVQAGRDDACCVSSSSLDDMSVDVQ